MAFSICTYNSNGSNIDRLAYIDKLYKSHDFILTQEHWLFDCRINNVYSDALGDCMVHGVSGMDPTVFNNGRPFGGCAIIWKNSLKLNVTPVDASSKRLCAVHISDNNTDYLLVNVYMPCNNNSNRNEYFEVLCEIGRIIRKYDSLHIIIGGDFNIDLCIYVESQQPVLVILKRF